MHLRRSLLFAVALCALAFVACQASGTFPLWPAVSNDDDDGQLPSTNEPPSTDQPVSPPTPSQPPTPPPTDRPTPSQPPTPPPTDPPTPPPGNVFDCATVANPATPTERVMSGARAYHGLAFDQNGFVVGTDGNNLIKSDYFGNWSVFVPGYGGAEQMDYLPNGDLAVATWNNTIGRVTPQGGQGVINGDTSAYGVITGPDGMLYVADNFGDEVNRIDPATGAKTLMAQVPDGSTHPVNFSPNFDRMYFGTVSGGSTVYFIELDGNMNPVGSPQVLTSSMGGSWHDGIAVDACGYLYVPEFWSSGFYRINPSTGQVIQLLDMTADSSQYGHGAQFGNGIGGWRIDAIYQPMPYGGDLVKEVVVGVPSREWIGTVINAP